MVLAVARVLIEVNVNRHAVDPAWPHTSEVASANSRKLARSMSTPPLVGVSPDPKQFLLGSDLRQSP
eukprot:2031534-Prymnesium_polylepis.1